MTSGSPITASAPEITGVAWVSAPPLLVPEIAPGLTEAADLRKAADDAVSRLVAVQPEFIIVIAATTPGAGPAPAPAPGAEVSWHGFGVGPKPAGAFLPWQLGVGAWLLDRAGWKGARQMKDLKRDEEAITWPTGQSSAALLVLGEGSARRSAQAPGHLDDRAEAWDRQLAQMLERGDLTGLAALDKSLGQQLMSTAATTFVGAARVLLTAHFQSAASDITYDAAPFGVGYIVASWSPSSPDSDLEPGTPATE